MHLVLRPSLLGIVLWLTFCIAGCASQTIPHLETSESCIDRDGLCFELTVNGREVHELNRSELKARIGSNNLTKVLEKVGEDRIWFVEELSTPLNFVTYRNSLGKDWFGGDTQAEISIRELNQNSEDITLRPPRSFDKNGDLIVAPKNILSCNKLKSGLYLFVVHLEGVSNWDRKWVVAQVLSSTL